jgi:hypothetical protein
MQEIHLPFAQCTFLATLGFLEVLGLVVIIGVALAVCALAWAAAWVFAGAKGASAPLPRLTLALMEFFRPLMLRVFAGNPDAFNRVCVELYNRLRLSAYSAVPLERRIVMLPQCLRHIDCPAPISATEGIQCKDCGKCIVCKIRKIDPRIAVFISPGGTLAKRILESHRPGAVLGVACPNDLVEGLRNSLRAGIPAQGVPLGKTGCVNTEVDFNAVQERLLAGIDVGQVRQVGRIGQ